VNEKLMQLSLQHGSCPTCRHIFLDIRPPSESDGESSDGDYNYEDEEDVEEELEVDEMDLDEDEDMDGEEEWDDRDTTFSEADMSISGEVAALAEDGTWSFLLIGVGGLLIICMSR
jgi:hypothetical protein